MTTTYANETIGISGLVLPDAPEPNTYRIDGEEVTEDRFIEWFDNPDPDEFLEKVIKEGKDGEPDRIEWKLLPGDLADAVCNRFKPAKYNNVDYYFDRVSRIYRRDNGTVRAWIYATLRNAQRDDKLPKTYNADRDVCTIARAAALSNVIESDTYPFNVYDGFPVNNGVIVFNKDGTFTVRNITSAMKFTRKAAVNYNPDRAAEKTQRAETILRQWLPEVIDGVQQWEWLVQIIAQAILQSLPDHDMFKASYILLGEADSGKTTAGDLNSLFFGRYNVSSKKLQQFGSRFDKGELVGKFVNYGDDIATIKVSDGNDIKELVGHRKQRVEEKYGIPYIADVTAVQVHSANALPAVDKSIWNDEAWWKRWRIIKFNGHFAKDISWSERNLDTDFLEGLLILAIAESCAIIRRGNRLRLDQPWNEVQDMWIGGESRFHEFYTESFCECPGNTIQRQTVLDSLKEWFDRYMTIPENVSAWSPGDIVRWRDTQWNLLPTTIPTLTAAMKREGAGVKQASSAHAQGTAARPYVFKDIAFKPTAVWEIRPVYVSSVPDAGGGVK